MTSILILGGSGDHRLFTALRKILERSLSLCFVGARGEICLRARPDIFLCEMEQAHIVKSEDTILVCKACFPHQSDTDAGQPPQVAVLGADDAAAARYLGDRCEGCITCGMSCRDTITLSSLHDEDAVICLQRAVTALDGTRVEPGEFPVRLSHRLDAYTVMACAATLIAAGQAHQLEGLVL